MDGPDRRAMECDQLYPTRRSGAARSAGPTVERSPTSTERNPLDPSHRCTLEGFARTIWEVPNSPSRFQNWVRSGVMERVLLAIAQDLKERGGLDLRECFIDGTFVPAKKGGAASGRP